MKAEMYFELLVFGWLAWLAWGPPGWKKPGDDARQRRDERSDRSQ